MKTLKKRQEKKKEDQVKIKTITIKGKFNVKNIADKLGELGFNRISTGKTSTRLMYVESETLSKKPYRYIEFIVTPTGLSVNFTITPETNEKKRIIDVSELLLRFLIYAGYENVDMKPIFRTILEGMAGVREIIDTNYEVLINKHEKLKKEHENTVKKLEETMKALESADRRLQSMERKVQELEQRIKELEVVSDESLKEMLIEWLKLHQGKINVYQFAKLHGLPTARVEEGLDRLMKEGYIEKV